MPSIGGVILDGNDRLRASNELGEFESGITASWFGLVRALVLGGVATLAVAGIWAWRFPVLSRMDRFPHLARDQTEVARPEEASSKANNNTPV